MAGRYTGKFLTYSGTSSANAAQTVTANPGRAFRLVSVSVDYSASGTGTLSVNLDSILGTGFDNVIQANSTAITHYYLPAGDAIFMAGDEVDAVCGAGGGTDTSACIVTIELV